MRHFRILGLVSALTLLPGLAPAATAVNDTFDTGAGAWTANTSTTSLVWNATLGNPGGTLESFNSGGAPVIGAANLDAAHTGAFAPGVWTISFDVNYQFGSFASTLLRFRFQDFSHNGWTYMVDGAPAANTGWHSYSVTFDTTWSDATAMANGWVQEPVSAPFATLWTDTYSAEVRINSSTTSGALIDNYRAVAPVPLPAGGGLLLAAFGALGAMLRRRRA